MKKLTKFTAFILSILLLFTSCSNFGMFNKRSKTITVSMSFGDRKPVFEAVAKEYMALNKDVNVVIDDREESTYADWLSLQLSGQSTNADIVQSNQATQYYAAGKFLDFTYYLNKKNPYSTDNAWKDSLDTMAYLGGGRGPNGECYQINTDSVVTCIFYNKDIFDKVGVKPPKTWTELIEISQKIKDAGYIPLSTAGDAMGFYVWMMGWLFRVYTDQYFRDMQNLILYQPTDYGYDPELLGNFKLDINDKSNDSNQAVFSKVRLAKLVTDGVIGPLNPKYKEMVTNLMKFFPKYVEPGFLAADNEKAIGYFIKGKSAMWIDSASFSGKFEKTVADAKAKAFKLGAFNYPAMEGNVGVSYTRTVGGANGFYSAINKSKEQNDLNADFMMFFASKKGQDIRLKAMGQNGLVPDGPSLIKGVTLDPKFQKIFDDLGNPGFADDNILSNISRGFFDDLRSVRAFQDNTQILFDGKMTVDDYCKKMNAAILKAVPKFLTNEGFRTDATQDFTKNPAIN